MGALLYTINDKGVVDGGSDQLSHYYLDFMNRSNSTTHTKLEQLDNVTLSRSIFGGKNATDIPEVSFENAETGYNLFYNFLLTLDGASIGDYMRGEKVLGKLDRAYSTDIATVAAGGAAETASAIKIDGLAGNAYQDMSFALEQQADVPPAGSFTVTVNYLDKATGLPVADAHQETLGQGLPYDATQWDKLPISGYTYDSTTGDTLTGTMDGNKVINVYYTVKDTPPAGSFTVTVNYLNKVTGRPVAVSHQETIGQDLPYDVAQWDKLPISGYTYDSTTGDALTGTMDGNKVINVYYTANNDDDDDDDDDDPPPPPVEIPDGEIPTTDFPPTTDLPDEQVPMADVPETGDCTLLWATMTGVSALGLAALFLESRKRKDVC